jgi:hypothetical protein
MNEVRKTNFLYPLVSVLPLTVYLVQFLFFGVNYHE